MCRGSMVIILVCALFLPTASTAGAAPQTIDLNAGLQGRIISIGRSPSNPRYVSVSLSLANTGKNTFYLLLTGDSTSVGVDNTGGSYAYTQISGIARCPASSVRVCIGVPAVTQGSTPRLEEWTELDPNTSPITVNFQLITLNNDPGPLLSLSGTLAYRTVANPMEDDTLSDAQKRGLNFSFPPMPVAQSR